VLPFGWSIRYFFLAAFFTAFFAAFFAGAFLAAFLVAICLFSLFDGLHRFCNTYIAVEECIDSRIINVKKKTMKEWKNGQQFFRFEKPSADRIRLRARCEGRGRIDFHSLRSLSPAQFAPAFRRCGAHLVALRLRINAWHRSLHASIHRWHNLHPLPSTSSFPVTHRHVSDLFSGKLAAIRCPPPPVQPNSGLYDRRHWQAR
jgi:hypothetical protein